MYDKKIINLVKLLVLKGIFYFGEKVMKSTIDLVESGKFLIS